MDLVFTAYREFKVDEEFDNIYLIGTIGVTAKIHYMSEKETRWEPGSSEVIVKEIKGIEFFQMIMFKPDKYGEYDFKGKRKEVLSISDKNIKKIRPKFEGWIKERFENEYQFDQSDLIDY